MRAERLKLSRMNFEERIRCEKENVLSLFLKHECTRVPYDFFAVKIIAKLHDSNFAFYKVSLEENELKKIILPHHIHDSNIVRKGGMPILDCCEILRSYSNNPNSKCLRKVKEIKVEMMKENSKCRESFILLSSDKETVHWNHYGEYSNSSLFIANGFHRLLALGLIYEEHGIIPMTNIFYCEPENIA